jgi:hypothetical protein
MQKTKTLMGNVLLSLVVAVGALALGCADDDEFIPVGSVPITGIAATGNPIANAIVTIKDTAGHVLVTSTGTDGTYSADIAGFSAPYLVEVDTGTEKYYSIGMEAAAGVINIHPYSDVLVRACYDAYGEDVETLFGSIDAASPMPPDALVEQVGGVVEGVINLWMVQNGVNPESYDLISTPFTAAGTGFDAVLNVTSVTNTPGSHTITVDDATIQQTTTVDVVDATDSMTVNTTTNEIAGTAESTAKVTGQLAATAELQSAVEGVQATLDQYKTIVNAHLLPLYTTDFLHEADDRPLHSGFMAEFLRGRQLLDQRIDHVVAFDPVAQLLTARVVKVLDGEVMKLTEVFKNDGTGWKFYGDQQVFGIPWHELVKALYVENSTSSTTTYEIGVWVLSQPGALDPANPPTVLGGPWATATATTSMGTNEETVQATPTTTIAYDRDTHWLSQTLTLATTPPAGTTIEVTVTLAGGSTVTVTSEVQATTTETVSFTTGLTGYSTSTDANLGGTLSIGWTLPKTFPAAFVELGCSYWGSADPNQQEGYVSGTKNIVGGLPPTSGSISIPALSPSDFAVDRAWLSVPITGQNGEMSEAVWYFDLP